MFSFSVSVWVNEHTCLPPPRSVWVHVLWYLCEGLGTTLELAFSHHMGPTDQTQFLRIGGRYSYLLSHLDSSSTHTLKQPLCVVHSARHWREIRQTSATKTPMLSIV